MPPANIVGYETIRGIFGYSFGYGQRLLDNLDSPTSGDKRHFLNFDALEVKMQNFPRLTALFGKPVNELDANAIQSAINNRTPEDVDLDWKEAHYPRDKNPELAKDVAQLANTVGGIIVLGVKENNGCADASTPVSLGDSEERRIREVISARIRPFLPGVNFKSIEISSGTGYLIIVVPQSADAPHAVVQDNGALAYPVRDGTKARWLTEYEVAPRYRDRFSARTAQGERLEKVHAEGISRIALWRSPWLAISSVPLISGRRGVGSEGLAAELAFVTSKWKQYAPPTSPFPQGPIRVIAGIRRAIVTETYEYAGQSARPHTELHYDGAGFGATCRLYSPAGDNSMIDGAQNVDADKIHQDAMEIQILALVLLLAHHAVDTGASGECLLRAHQLLRQQTGPDRAVTPAQMCEPVSWTGRGDRTEYQVVNPSLTISIQTQPADTSVFLDELVSDIRAVVRTSYGLAADILGEFGVSEPIILRPDGQLNLHRLLKERKANIEPWAQQNDLVAPPAVPEQ
jgi:hypothetical protein